MALPATKGDDDAEGATPKTSLAGQGAGRGPGGPPYEVRLQRSALWPCGTPKAMKTRVGQALACAGLQSRCRAAGLKPGAD